MAENWLNALKVGDKVAIRFSGRFASGTNYVVDYVHRITKTLIITNNGYKFRKQNGDVSPFKYGEKLHEFTTEIQEIIDNQEIERKFSVILLRKKKDFSFSAKKAIVEALQKVEAEGE